MRLIFTVLTLLLANVLFAQSNIKYADSVALVAIKLMDMRDPDPDRAIKLLEEAKRIAPEKSYNYDYEIGYALYMKQEYKEAIKKYESISNDEKVEAALFQMLGNAYDLSGDKENALISYNRGIEKFPKSGRLYLELGNMQAFAENYNGAVEYYEKGVKVDPMYPSNYFQLASIFLNTEEEVWGMMYGELFILLELNTKRTAMISEYMYNTYKSEITRTDDTSLSISFSKAGNYVDASKMDDKDFKLPFSTFVYEPIIGAGAGVVDSLNYNGICEMRSVALEMFNRNKSYKKYKNVLFDYQTAVEKAGHLEAYNHWLLKYGDMESFRAWYENNKASGDAFANWIVENPIEITAKTVFLRTYFL